MNIQNIKIQIVEDDAFFSNLVKNRLEKERFHEISTFSSGEDFLTQIQTSPDVVILDYSLGKMNGLEILKQIRSINPNIQVILLSAQEKMAVAVESLKFGAYDYLQKTDEGLARLGNLVRRIAQMKALINTRKQLKKDQIIFFITFALAQAALFYFGKFSL